MINDSNKLKSFIKQLSSISQQYGKRAVIENINNAIDKIDNSTSILFCGEFKRGKSSLINAIIGDEICPTDIGIATAVVTRIMYGQTKKVVRYYGNLLEGENSLKKEYNVWKKMEKFPRNYCKKLYMNI